VFLEAVAKTEHEKTLRRGHECQNVQRPCSQRLYQKDQAVLGASFKQIVQGAIGRCGWSGCALLPSLACGNSGRDCIELNEHGSSCATSECLYLLLPGPSHHFKSGYAENPYP